MATSTKHCNIVQWNYEHLGSRLCRCSEAAGFPLIAVESTALSLWQVAHHSLWIYDYDLGVNNSSIARALCDRGMVGDILQLATPDPSSSTSISKHADADSGGGGGSIYEHVKCATIDSVHVWFPETWVFVRYSVHFDRQPSLITCEQLLSRYGALVLQPVCTSDRKTHNDMVLISTQQALHKQVIRRIDQQTLLVTPYIAHTVEYRVVLWQRNIDSIVSATSATVAQRMHSVLLCLEYRPLLVHGNGQHTILQLVLEAVGAIKRAERQQLNGASRIKIKQVLADMKARAALEHLEPDTHILPHGCQWQVTWRLKRSVGAQVRVVARSERIYQSACSVALAATRKVPMRFGCVSMLQTLCDPTRLVVHSMAYQHVLLKVLEYVDEPQVVLFLRQAYDDLIERFATTRKHVHCDPLRIAHATPTQPQQQPPEQQPAPTSPQTLRQPSTFTKQYTSMYQMYHQQLRSVFPDATLEHVAMGYLTIMNHKHFLFRYSFGFNTSVVNRLCTHKASTSTVLQHCGVPCVPHLLFDFRTPSARADFAQLRRVHRSNACYSVLKPNEGSSGHGVVRVKSDYELERAVALQHDPIVVCAYCSIVDEHRVIMVNRTVVFIYTKQRLQLEGDGHSSISQLVCDFLHRVGHPERLGVLLQSLGASVSQVPPAKQRFLVAWMHNLDALASPVPIDLASPKAHELTQLALATANAIGLNYGAVDIIDEGHGATMRVLEVNGTPGFDRFSDIFGPEPIQQLLAIFGNLLQDTDNCSDSTAAAAATATTSSK
jgi:glutathione synthase/RimK-type ligase-like ATP-grasp enzyme